MIFSEFINNNPRIFKTRKLLFVGILLTFHFSLLTLLSSCDQTFDPIKKEGAGFSILGYLDASADTQWVRVTPQREQLAQSEFKPEMTVTLENLESGESTVMNDSLFLNPDGFHYLNVWTTMEVHPGVSYRLKAKHSDGRMSHATVTIPNDFPTPILSTSGNGYIGDLLINDVENLADVQTLWIFDGSNRIPYRSLAFKTSRDEYDFQVRLYADYDLSLILGPNRPNTLDFLANADYKRQVYVASGGPEWIDDFASMEDIVYNLPKSFSNVEGGVGYLVGIVSKTIPFKSCYDDDGVLIACPLEKPLF